MLTFIRVPHNSTVLRIVNIATSGGPGFVNCIRLYQDSDLRDDNCWQPGHFIQTRGLPDSLEIFMKMRHEEL